MSVTLVVVFGLIGLIVLATGVGVWAWRRADVETRSLIGLIADLPLRAKLRLAVSLAGDHRVPLFIRLLPPALVIYLAMPFDFVPDFIPVIGQLDDLIVMAAGVGLLLRFTPRGVLEEKVTALRPPAQGS